MVKLGYSYNALVICKDNTVHNGNTRFDVLDMTLDTNLGALIPDLFSVFAYHI